MNAVGTPLKTPIKVTDNLVSVDARLMSGAEFMRFVFGEKVPEHVRVARSMARRGKPQDAIAYMEACDRFRAASKWPAYEWPNDLTKLKSEI